MQVPKAPTKPTILQKNVAPKNPPSQQKTSAEINFDLAESIIVDVEKVAETWMYDKSETIPPTVVLVPIDKRNAILTKTCIFAEYTTFFGFGVTFFDKYQSTVILPGVKVY